MGKSEVPDMGLQAGDLEAGKHTGYQNLNQLCLSLSPPLAIL